MSAENPYLLMSHSQEMPPGLNGGPSTLDIPLPEVLVAAAEPAAQEQPATSDLSASDDPSDILQVNSAQDEAARAASVPWGMLVEEWEIMRRFAIKLLGPSAYQHDGIPAADDFASEAILVAAKKITEGRLAPPDLSRSWLFTVVRNRVADVMRQRRTRPEDLAEDLSQSPTGVNGDGMASSESQTGASLLAGERHADIAAHLAALMEPLTPKSRKILYLYIGQELTAREVADLVEDMKEGSVRVHAHRVLHRLRKSAAAGGSNPR